VAEEVEAMRGFVTAAAAGFAREMEGREELRGRWSGCCMGEESCCMVARAIA
jgi:hypothetical protein